MESTAEITAWDPPNLYGQKSIDSPFPFEFTMKLEPKENGTDLTMSGSAEPGGFFKLAEGLLRKQLEKQFSTDLKGLKLAMEKD